MSVVGWLVLAGLAWLTMGVIVFRLDLRWSMARYPNLPVTAGYLVEGAVLCLIGWPSALLWWWLRNREGTREPRDVTALAERISGNRQRP